MCSFDWLSSLVGLNRGVGGLTGAAKGDSEHANETGTLQTFLLSALGSINLVR